MSSNSNLTSMRRLVDQLKLEASVDRIKVSQAAADLQQYCLQNACKDALLVGLPSREQPFQGTSLLLTPVEVRGCRC